MSHPDTLSVHAGYQPDSTGAVMPPIYLSSTYAQRAPGEHSGFEYGRSGNPSRQAFELALAELEGGTAGFAFASGLGAMTTVLELLEAGSEIVAVDDLYGGAWRLFEQVKARSAGLKVRYVAPDDLTALRSAITPATKLVWLEVPTNPLLKFPDIAAITEIARGVGALTVVDATFVTPYLLKPLEFGADIVLHSITKYLNGHSDVIGGAVIVKDQALADKLRWLQNAVGAILAPFDSFLALRGLRTLALRMQRHSSNALTLARWLQQQSGISDVIYPGLASHPQHALAQRLLPKGQSGIISIRLNTDAAGLRRFVAALKLFTLAESLGGVESLINHPWSMTHAAIPEALRIERGIGENLLRLSVGIEHPADLQADLAQALAAI
ncbi:PLP-dependent aspartate aminotransferase family protein [Undibacterium sp. CY21W]|uniref:trans-sulfuration enzyme family protein n=1 Tax=Undibacterium sp. CY21W TaxID=2762293 RepID=UPI00164C7160|nr:PLP-dependent aspartate aminotransferase family protein [Undibacterium sp. CY21W]MBC3926861.1 PLP-dependent transferase [Undibacterium sp. CY21W]